MGEHEIDIRIKTLLQVYYANDLSILHENIDKTNEFSQVLLVHGARTGLKINVKKTKSLILGISKGEEVTLDNEKIDLVEVFTQVALLVQTVGCSEDIKSRIVKGQVFFSQVKKFERI